MNDEGALQGARDEQLSRRSEVSTEARRELLERYGAIYGELGLAIAFTDGIKGEDAKRCTSGWKEKARLKSAEQGKALMGTGLAKNPIVALKASGLIGVDVDGEQGRSLVRYLKLKFPSTVAVRTSNGGHLWFRPPEGAPIGVVKVQFSDKLTTSGDGYLVCPPARHPDGMTYAFVEGHEPWAITIAELPLSIVELFAVKNTAGKAAQRVNTGPVAPGDRHEHLRQISYAMRRYSGASQEAIEAALIAENELRCRPPKAEHLVRELAAYTYQHIQPIGDDE
jgi:Bifunctional DNA primase/polymerase, N-terminal